MVETPTERTPLENITGALHALREIVKILPVQDRILRLDAVLDQTGLTRARLYAEEKAGRFPARVSLGGEAGRMIGWRESEVQAWIAARPRVITNPSVEV